MSSHEPAFYPWIRLALEIVGGLATMAVLVALAGIIEGPARALANYAASFGASGVIVALVALVGAPAAFARWSMRRDECRQIAETGTLHVEPPLDTRRTLKRIFLVTSPLWAVVAVLFVMCIIATIGGR